MNACDCPDCGTDDIAHNECHSGYCEECCPDCWGYFRDCWEDGAHLDCVIVA